MHKIYTFKDNHKLNFIGAITSITCLLIGSNSFYQAVHAVTPAKAPTTAKPAITAKKVDPKTEVHKAANRHASTAVATLRVYTKSSDIKSDSLLKNLIKSAVSADSPDSNPDASSRAAAILNLDINETLAASLFRQHTFDINQLDDIDKENFVLGNLTHGNVMHIAKGNGLFVPKKDIVVLADLADIHIGAGSMVGILHPTPDMVAIYDLEDGGSKRVSVKVGDETLALSPGKSLIISKEDHEFEQINPARRIPYRKLESKKLKSGLYTHSTEFSISAAVIHVKPLRKILLSNDPEDRKIANRLLKNQVILEDVFSESEPYKMPASIVTPVKISNKPL